MTSEDIQHQQTLLRIYKRNLELLTKQAKHYGGFELAPIYTQNGILEAQANIERIEKILEDATR